MHNSGETSVEINIHDKWINIYDLIHIKELEKEKTDTRLQQFISFIRKCRADVIS